MKHFLMFVFLFLVGCDASSPRPIPVPVVQKENVQFESIISGVQYKWEGRLYSLGEPDPRRPLQLLLGGVSYDTGLYWDSEFYGINEDSYNYSKWMAEREFDVLVIDLKPELVGDGDIMTLQHQERRIWITLLSMAARGYSPNRTHCIGHSAGAMEMTQFVGSGIMPNCATLVNTGWSATPHELPAYITPELVNGLLENETVVYPSAFREKAFYRAGSANFGMIAYDNSVATGSPRARVLSSIGALMNIEWTNARKVTVPVLLIAGEYDELYPAEVVYADKSNAFIKAQSVDFEVQALSGHSLNLHRGHIATWQFVLNWLQNH